MWTYNNIRITVTNFKNDTEQTIAELQPVNYGTIYQTFGWVNPKLNLGVLVVGLADKDSLEALMNDGTAYILSGADVTWGSYYLKKLSLEWMNSYRQDFRTDKDPFDYVFKGTMELAKV